MKTFPKRPACFILPFILLFAGKGSAAANGVEAETQKLIFQVSRLSSKGDIADQIQQCLEGLQFPIIHLRAFIVGEKSIDKVKAAFENAFKKLNLSLPAMNIVGVGGLPQESHMILEIVSMARKAVNPYGIAFISGQVGFSEKPISQISSLMEKSMGNLSVAHQSIGCLLYTSDAADE